MQLREQQHDVQTLQDEPIDVLNGSTANNLLFGSLSTTGDLDSNRTTVFLEPQTLEGSPLDALLDRPYVPRSRSLTIKSPPENIWNRWQIINWMWSSWRHVPDPNLDIEFGTIFYREKIPTTGKLYAKCAFIDCELERPKGNYSLVGCYVEGGSIWDQIAGFGGEIVGNVQTQGSN